MIRRRSRTLIPLEDRGPLRVLFLVTSLPVGGAETLLINLVRRLDRELFLPEVCCLKQRGPLGDVLAEEIPVHSRLLAGKYDVRVWPRLTKLLDQRRIDAVVTVGAGDKMFWGRLAAWRVGVPVVLSAIHSTGWPDSIGWLNRRLTSITDGFIAVATSHGRHLVDNEGFPLSKVHVIANGVDTDRFRELPASDDLRRQLDIPAGAPVLGTVAALRPEKNHELLLETLKIIHLEIPDAHLLFVGDGPRRPRLQLLAAELGVADRVRFLGNRDDVPEIFALFNAFALTSHNEASPVSILEAMACAKPVIATRVGSVAESVQDAATGFLVDPGDARRLARYIIQLFRKPELARRMGRLGREAVVRDWSLDRMVEGYQRLISQVYAAKAGTRPGRSTPGLCPVQPVR